MDNTVLPTWRKEAAPGVRSKSSVYQIWELAPLEREEVLRRVQPYDAQLPEYHFLVKQLLTPQGAPEQD